MKKIILVLIIFSLPPTIFTKEIQKNKIKIDANNIELLRPIQSVRDKNFKLNHLGLNRFTEINGRGEILELEFQMENISNYITDYYIFVVATYEVVPKILTSFDRPRKQKEKLWSFVSFPDNNSNFEYTIKDKKKLFKYPKDIKKGVNPSTNKPYTLSRKFVFYSKHLSKYRNNYHFFNGATLLIFNKDEKLVYRQEYAIRGIK